MPSKKSAEMDVKGPLDDHDPDVTSRPEGWPPPSVWQFPFSSTQTHHATGAKDASYLAETPCPYESRA